MSSDLFRFRFNKQYPSYYNDNGVVTVYSHYREYIDIFLAQHTFNPDNANVELIEDNDNLCNNMILVPFKFKSNKLPGEYIIISTNEIIEECLLNVSHSLDKTLNFGSSFIYHLNNIEIFKYIQSIIINLPYAVLTDNPDSYDNAPGGLYGDEDSYINNPNEASIFQRLIHQSGNIMSISLEGYISAFTDIVIERYIPKSI